MTVSFSPTLEQSLQRAGAIAREQSRVHAPPEYLLIALMAAAFVKHLTSEFVSPDYGGPSPPTGRTFNDVS
jgi:hypothetical protein